MYNVRFVGLFAKEPSYVHASRREIELIVPLSQKLNVGRPIISKNQNKFVVTSDSDSDDGVKFMNCIVSPLR